MICVFCQCVFCSFLSVVPVPVPLPLVMGVSDGAPGWPSKLIKVTHQQDIIPQHHKPTHHTPTSSHQPITSNNHHNKHKTHQTTDCGNRQQALCACEPQYRTVSSSNPTRFVCRHFMASVDPWLVFDDDYLSPGCFFLPSFHVLCVCDECSPTPTSKSFPETIPRDHQSRQRDRA